MMFGVIILALIGFYIFNSSNDGGSCCTNHQSQVHTPDILNDRYARSEMNRDEYLERKQELCGQKQKISIKKG